MKTLTPVSPERIAQNIVATPGFTPAVLNSTRAAYLKNAERMREVAAKAAASRSGKFRGYTQARALAVAELHTRYSEEVPAAARRLIAA